MKKLLTTSILFFTGLMLYAQANVGQLAPEISLPDAKGNTVSLSSFKGKIVLIDFWASWCRPCREANPQLVNLYKKYKANGFEVFGVSIDNKKSAWIKAIKQDKITYSQVIDPDGWNSKVAAKYGVESIPSSFLLNKKGVVVAIDLEGKNLEAIIKELLK